MPLLPVLTPEQSRAWDAAATAAGRSIDVLMENAGRAVATVLLDRFGGAAASGVLVACGPGNNGGDGWVAARTLHAIGVPTWVAAVPISRDGPAAAAAARAAALADGVRVVAIDGPWPGVALVVDALLGTGASGAPRDAMAPLVQRLHDLERPIIAVDGPTGLDLATGVQHGPLRAAMTITFGGARRGHLLARDEIGDLVIVDIGLPPADPAWPALIDDRWAARRVAPFHADAHKGVRGRVVIVGGSPTMTGASRMAARSAFAAGAGLVFALAPAESLEVLRTAEPDLQVRQQSFGDRLDAPNVELLEQADAVAIGPGLGREAGRTRFVLDVLAHARTAVVDADALTVLKSARDGLAQAAAARPLVLTPHIGEFRTLFPEVAEHLETAPWDAAARAAHACGATVLLKGVPTVVATPDGRLLTVAAGNPGLATGGSGDVLTGLIAALLGQGVALPDAAAVAAQAMGEAADHAARRVTARAMRPMDVVTALPEVWKAWQRPQPLRRAPVLLDLPAPTAV